MNIEKHKKQIEKLLNKEKITKYLILQISFDWDQDFLNKKSLKTDYKFSNDNNYLKEIISNDKKVSNDIIKFVLIEDIEKPILIDLHINDLLEVLING